MSAIVVTPQMLIDTSRAVAAKAGEIDGSLSNLASHVQTLTADWQGQAQGRFTALYEQWQTSAGQLHEALLGISRLLNTAGIAYDDSEAQISRMFIVS
jgi:WXG100 family type VII secretion target